MKRMTTAVLTALIALLVHGIAAAAPSHVEWSARIENKTAQKGTLIITANIESGWHIYGVEMPDMGDEPGVPDATSIEVEPTAGLVMTSGTTTDSQPTVHFDEFLNLNLPWLQGTVELKRDFELSDGVKGVNINGYVKFMACNANSCTPPAKYEFSLDFGDMSAAVQTADTETAAVPAATSPAATAGTQTENEWWEPVAVETNTTAQSYWAILLFGFLGGLVALMTPCVWPMIPMTVSFFLKKNKSRRRSIADAVIYSASIIVIFLVLGILLTVIFGPGKLNEIATGAVFNIIFFVLLVVFAISFFGAFNLSLPSSWSTAIDNKAENTTGLLSIFFMAFTLVLVSFSCTGPIIGTLLVEAFSQQNLLGPLLGMGGFALGLALPFGLFAFFPSMLKGLPQSGGWLNTVKVVLGFIELILSLKFLSVADLAYGWRILDREVFIALWIVLFVLLGMYLLGKLRFSHDSPMEHTPVGRFFLALGSFAFAVYLVPGLWGAPLKAISAFAPPLYTQDFNLYGGEFQKFHDYDEGMAYAAAHNKPVLVDFSGYACVNCRKMEGAVFDTPAVRGIIEQDYVMIVLMVDDKKELAEPMIVTEDGKTKTLTTVGERWSYLQYHKFGISSQPYYILLDNKGKPLSAPRVYDENVGAFTAWLEEGIETYKQR
ncbi:MAG: thioredoxin family protein [Muribaculaceae bacterium]|nr:thioredoxin family protein [Muribaculaceae bacterium]